MKPFARARRRLERFLDEAPDSEFMPWIYGGLGFLILVAACLIGGVATVICWIL